MTVGGDQLDVYQDVSPQLFM